jgi:hypothetical protein
VLKHSVTCWHDTCVNSGSVVFDVWHKSNDRNLQLND